MAIRKIKYTVNTSGIEPSVVQSGGVQGEHNATELVFLLDSALLTAVREVAGNVVYRFDGYTGTGAKSSTEPFPLPEGDTVTLTYPLENWLTHDGGNIQVYLVITAIKDGETELDLYSFPAIIRLKNTPDSEDIAGENYESLSTLAQSARRSAEDAAGSVIKSTMVNENGELLIIYADGTEINAGKVKGEPGKDAVTDQTYNPTSANAQSGLAVAEAISGIPISQAIPLPSALGAHLKPGLYFATGVLFRQIAAEIDGKPSLLDHFFVKSSKSDIVDDSIFYIHVAKAGQLANSAVITIIGRGYYLDCEKLRNIAEYRVTNNSWEDITVDKDYVDSAIRNIEVGSGNAPISSLSAVLGENILSATDTWTLDDNWSGNCIDGFNCTANASNDTTISVPIPNSGINYYLVTFTAEPKLAMDAVTVSLGGSATYDLYKGTETDVSNVYTAGIRSADDGDLVFTASKGWSGTISNISVQQITEPLAAERVVSDMEGNILDEQRYNPLDLQNIWHGYKVGSMNVSGYGNVGMGYRALEDNTSGFWNIGIGRLAMNNNTVGSRNIGIGQQALSKHRSGLRNVAIGSFAMSQLESGNRNIAIGVDAMISAISGVGNIGIGYVALARLNGGYYNVSLGDFALSNLTTGSYNFALGMYSQQNNESGSKNVGIGYQTIRNNKTGTQNIAIGHNAMAGGTNASFSRNIGIGENAGYNLTSGQNNIFIGHAAGQKITSGVGNILIGYQIGGTSSDANTFYQLNIGGLISGCLYNGTLGSTVYEKYVKINGGLDLSDIPAIDPNIKGRVWNDNGTLKISTGAVA